MKKIILIGLTIFSSIMGYSQLKLFNNGNVSVGTLNNLQSSRLYVEGSDTKASVYGGSGTSATFWAFNMNYAYGFGIKSNSFGYIYRDINSPVPIMTFDQSGRVGIGGNPQSGYTLKVSGNVCVYGSGTYYGTWTQSDLRIKKDVTTVSNSLDIVLKSRGTSYNYVDEDFAKESGFSSRSYGLIAQEVKEVVPELVKAGDDSILAINYDGYIPILIEAIKEQQKQIEALKEEVQELKLSSNTLTDGSNFNNYPNPFNNETKIDLSVPSGTKHASINIFDSNGNLIKEIKIKDRGNTTITFSASNLSAGVYSYALIADNKVINTNKMIIQK